MLLTSAVSTLVAALGSETHLVPAVRLVLRLSGALAPDDHKHGAHRHEADYPQDAQHH